jgi:hypothetical protein
MNHETIRRTLAQRAGGDADANAVAKAAISTWHEASARLSPVIGGQGIDVLLRRSLHVAGKTFPALPEPTHEARNNVLLANLQMRLAACETALAVEASNALLVTFTELMSSLIGESLTEHLLAPIWAPSLPASDQKGAP